MKCDSNCVFLKVNKEFVLLLSFDACLPEHLFVYLIPSSLIFFKISFNMQKIEEDFTFSFVFDPYHPPLGSSGTKAKQNLKARK
jgi:hypothetical protein